MVFYPQTDDFFALKMAIGPLPDPFSHLEQAIQSARLALEKKIKHLEGPVRDIFEAQLSFFDDPELLDDFRKESQSYGDPVEVLYHVYKKWMNLFSLVEDPVFSERASDFEDCVFQILAVLLQIENDPRIDFLHRLTVDSILTAKDLHPSIFLEIKDIRGLLLGETGLTAHTLILARNRGIPAITGLPVNELTEGSIVFLNGQTGILSLEPEQSVSGAAFPDRNTVSPVSAASEASDDFDFSQNMATQQGKERPIDEAILWNADSDAIAPECPGIGLFRSEFIFMKDPSLVSSIDAQASYYVHLFENLLRGRQGTAVSIPVTLRLIDQSGDKRIPILDRMGKTESGLAFLLANRDVLEIQLAAIQKACSASETIKNNIKVKILVPMIRTYSEVKEFISIYHSVVNCKHIELGAMIETASICSFLSTIEGDFDFFSIGSNDLCSSYFCVLRECMSEELWFDRSFLQLLDSIRKGVDRPLGICGGLVRKRKILENLPLEFSFFSVAPEMEAEIYETIRSRCNKEEQEVRWQQFLHDLRSENRNGY